MKLRLIAILFSFAVSLPGMIPTGWSQIDRAGIKEPAEARISGLPITLGVVFFSLCYELVPPFNFSSIVTVHKTPGLVTVRVVGYCPPLFVAVDQRRTIALEGLAPGVYDLRYVFYNFDGSFVSEGLVRWSDPENRPYFPFTVLAPTQENLDRVFRVPTLSQIGMGTLALLIGALGLRRIRRRAR